MYAFLLYQIAHSFSSLKKKKNAHSVCERCAIQRLTDYSAKTLKNKKKTKNKNKKKQKQKQKQKTNRLMQVRAYS